MSTPTVLCILDGWGLSSERTANAPLLAQTPNFDRLMATCPNATLVTHGPEVGLPTGQMGNSEVGHTNIGAGRIVPMDLGKIDLAIEDQSFFTNSKILAFADVLRKTGGTAHIMGVISNGGVHAHLSHMLAAIKLFSALDIPIAIHAISDGRDVGPTTAKTYFKILMDNLPQGAQIATIIGR